MDFNINTPKKLTELLNETEDKVLKKETISIEQIKKRIEQKKELDQWFVKNLADMAAYTLLKNKKRVCLGYHT